MTLRASAGIDIGGTFCDCVLRVGEREFRAKAATVRSAPHESALNALAATVQQAIHSDCAPDSITLRHGTTIATNALIEGRGARVVLVCTAGMRDVVEIGYLRRPAEALYNPHWQKPAFIVRRSDRLEIRERTTSSGEVLRSPTEQDLEQLVGAIRDRTPSAVAVCFLFSHVNPENENAVAAALESEFPSIEILRSSEILPEAREYERWSTTAIAAALRPLVNDYLKVLGRDSTKYSVGRFFVMQSNGGLGTAQAVIANPGKLVLSGPAAGVTAARGLAGRFGFPSLVTADMGGTSLDVSVVKHGDFGMRRQQDIQGMPLKAAAMDIRTIGAGGGSIITVDGSGTLRIGPESAGAQPGPAAYGNGGENPTVTDAAVVLGLLGEEGLLDGAIRLRRDLAEKALGASVGSQLGLSAVESARAVYAVTIASMSTAIRSVTVQRGVDPREAALLAYGGAAGLYAVDLAESLGMEWIIVPPSPGLQCAGGLLQASLVYDFARSWDGTSRDGTRGLSETYRLLSNDAGGALCQAEIDPDAAERRLSVDISYKGQGFPISIACDDLLDSDADWRTTLSERFMAEYESQFGYSRPDLEVEYGPMRLRVTAETGKDPLGGDGSPYVHDESSGETAQTRRRITLPSGGSQEVPVVNRRSLGPTHRLSGPAIICEYDSTTYVPPGYTAVSGLSGALIIGTRAWSPAAESEAAS